MGDKGKSTCWARRSVADLFFHKGILNELNKKGNLRFPLKGKVKNLDDKVGIEVLRLRVRQFLTHLQISLLIQAALGAVPIMSQNSKPLMAQEQSFVIMQAQRIARCILEVAVEKKDFKYVRSAIEL